MGDTPDRLNWLNAKQSAFHQVKSDSERTLRSFDYHVAAVLADQRVSKKTANFIDSLWNGNNPSMPVSLAQRPVRVALTQAVALVLLRHCEHHESASCGPDRLRLLSVCPDVGYCDYAGGTLEFGAVRRRSRRTMRTRSLEGLAMVDSALIDPKGRGQPTSIGIHYHAACSTRPGADPGTPEYRAWQVSKKRNKFGLKVCRQDILASPLTTEGVAKLGGYISKISAGLKEDNKHTTRGSQTLWSKEHALRTLEVYSHVSPAAALIGVGPLGKQLLKECLSVFWGFLGRSPSNEEIDHKALSKDWRRLFRELELNLRPLKVCGG